MGRKWRAMQNECIYVIPDIHGAYGLLELILKQILPLRKSDGRKDQLVFLGDYVDRSIESHMVIERLAEVKAEFPNQTHFLMGNHEFMMLKAFDRCKQSKTIGLDLEVNFRNWVHNGGYATIKGYLDRAELTDDDLHPTLMYDMPRFRVEQIIPKHHWEFFENLEPYYCYDKYLFVHAGVDPYDDIAKHEIESLVWDRSLCKTMHRWQAEGGLDNVKWEQTIVSGHDASMGVLIHPNYMMLDVGAPDRLICVEMNSLETVMAHPGHTRLVKVELKNFL